MTPEPQWITTPHLRADHRGPVDRPYTPMVDPASAPPILEMLQSVARGQPDCVAIEEHDARLTYRELIDKVEQLRAAIERAQPVPGRVGILLPPSVDYAVALFAVLAAGRPSVLLDESHPEARNASIGAATGINLVLAARDRGWPDAVTLRVARDADPRPSAHFARPRSGSTNRRSFSARRAAPESRSRSFTASAPCSIGRAARTTRCMSGRTTGPSRCRRRHRLEASLVSSAFS